MKILFCNYEYPPLGGGGGVINAQLAEELAKTHDITVLTSQAFGLEKEEIVNGVRLIRVPVFFRRQNAAANFPSMLAYLPMGMAAGKKLLHKERFDIINTHFVLPTGPVGDKLASAFNIPNILSVHGGDLYDPSKASSPHRHGFLRAWIRKLLHKADHVVGQSSNTVDNVHQYYDENLPVSKIPLGIQRPPETQGCRESLGIPNEDIVLVTVGRLVARKAVDQLITMLKQLNNSKVHLIVIGSGPQQENLMSQAKELGVDKNIHFAGFVTDEEKFSLMKSADMFTSTSQHEGFGLVYLEAMALGLPVICYDFGGQTDFLTQDKTGAVVPLNNLELFTQETKKLVDNPALLKEIGHANLENVKPYYIDQCALQYEQLFEKYLKHSK